ncbi:U32 family peptidase [Patescibacteria group bacterium]|nr:U32 family peptidase [Patescibacteria group bacterium]
MTKLKKPEIMCPIRDFASLQACKDYADAVYFGVNDFSMRANADAIKLSDLKRFVTKCHKYNIKAYLTVNTMLYNDDMKKVEQIIKKAKENKVDAIIVWDIAAIEIAKKQKMKFFISTQANVSNTTTTKFYQKLGACRIVLARELTFKQIKKIIKDSKIEIEVFVHGAMCVGVSGRCVLSSYLYSKSANCGTCSQPCRKEWMLMDEKGEKITSRGKYFLSAKDICLIEQIPQLIKAGVASFKIEGRKRDPHYIATTARCYKEAVESFFNNDFTKTKVKVWKKDLDSVYNRGYSTGFYFGTPGKEGISYDKADNVSTVKKELAGVVLHYYPKLKVGLVKLNHKGIKIGDKVVIEGSTTFLEQKITSIEMDNKQLTKAKKTLEVGIKFNARVRPKDKIFLLK